MLPAPHTATMHPAARRGTGATELLGLLLLVMVMMMMSRSAHAGELLASSQRYPRLGAVSPPRSPLLQQGKVSNPHPAAQEAPGSPGAPEMQHLSVTLCLCKLLPSLFLSHPGSEREPEL